MCWSSLCYTVIILGIMVALSIMHYIHELLVFGVLFALSGYTLPLYNGVLFLKTVCYPQ